MLIAYIILCGGAVYFSICDTDRWEKYSGDYLIAVLITITLHQLLTILNLI
jgi:hypothetical protein